VSPSPEPSVVAPREPSPEEKALAELAELVRRALGNDAGAKTALRRHHYVSLRHEGALGPEAAARVVELVRGRIARDEAVRFVPGTLLRSLRTPALKLEVHEVEVRTAYVQDYSKGFGRLVGKLRLAPHPKTVKVEIVELSPVDGAARVLGSYSRGTPALDVAPDSARGLTDAQVWDATIDALLKTLSPWPGRF
jgi:hypothetical protein